MRTSDPTSAVTAFLAALDRHAVRPGQVSTLKADRQI
jgi:hypothetical protein